MKAPDFEYARPETLADAIALLGAHGADAMALAGGQSLIPMMNFRVAAPEILIDLDGLADLKGIQKNDNTLTIGAMTRYVELMLNADVQACAPLISMALPHVAHDAIRNRGTLGGSLALADPAAEMPAVMRTLDATVNLSGPQGSRAVKADDFFAGYYETTRADDELIVSIDIPITGPEHRFGFHEITQRHGDYALAGVAISVVSNTWRVCFFGVCDHPVRLPDLETALAQSHQDDHLLPHLDQIDFNGDLKASAATRKRLAGVALKRALGGMTV